MRKKGTTALITLLAAAALVFGLLWRQESQDRTDLRRLAQASAQDACTQFLEYQSGHEESSYWYGVAAFRSFEQAYYLLTEGTPKASNYVFCNEVYGALVLSPEESRVYLPELIEIMELLSHNVEDENAYSQMADLRNFLNHHSERNTI